jgi:hypothetical protein
VRCLEVCNGSGMGIGRLATMKHVDRKLVPALLTRREFEDFAGAGEIGPRAEAVRHRLDAEGVGPLRRALPLLQPRELGLGPGDTNACRVELTASGPPDFAMGLS